MQWLLLRVYLNTCTVITTGFGCLNSAYVEEVRHVQSLFKVLQHTGEGERHHAQFMLTWISLAQKRTYQNILYVIRDKRANNYSSVQAATTKKNHLVQTDTKHPSHCRCFFCCPVSFVLGFLFYD